MILRSLIAWARLLWMLPTHKAIRIAPGVWIQALWGTTEAQIAASCAAYARNLKGK